MVKKTARLLTLLYSVLITIALVDPAASRLLARQASGRPWGLWFQDGVHFWTMAVLAFLVLLCRFPIRLLWAAVGLVAYAMLTEFAHLLLQERAFQWGDLGQNLAGVTSVILIYVICAARWSHRMENESP